MVSLDFLWMVRLPVLVESTVAAAAAASWVPSVWARTGVAAMPAPLTTKADATAATSVFLNTFMFFLILRGTHVHVGVGVRLGFVCGGAPGRDR
ncbi:hypothetical protein CFRA_06675 [Corynebacterium frankenforstense DSM 45800]|uniref:Uncharacterized protein n=1 Tax=Corynebacterium frankenforstense DSM 45800 TaxID=1437875 RepID=A0A1L7CT00_9CORY|nr:hypothetical protein CFRA_06675 [Corynebacterium frankenforstense DSM 45800]